jgi:hypothetical protein
MARYNSSYTTENNTVDERKRVVLEIVLRSGRVVFTGYRSEDSWGTGITFFTFKGDGCSARTDKAGLLIKAKYEMQKHKSAKVRGVFAEALKNGEGLVRCEIRQGPYGVEFRVGDAPFQLGPPGTQGKPLEELREKNAFLQPSMHFVIV